MTSFVCHPKEPFFPESSIIWLMTYQTIWPQSGGGVDIRLTCWRYSLLTGVGRPMFICSHGLCGVVESYFVSAIWQEDSVSLSIIHTDTRQQRTLRFNEDPPIKFQGVVFFLDGLVLYSMRDQSTPRKLWAYKYVPDKENPDVWNLKSSAKVHIPCNDAHKFLFPYPWRKFGKDCFGTGVKIEDQIYYFIYDNKKETWSTLTYAEMIPRDGFGVGGRNLHAFKQEWRSNERDLFHFCGHLTSNLDECVEGLVLAAPGGFAPQYLTEDWSEEDVEGAPPALFLSPGNNPPSLHTLAFRALKQNHPSLLEESHQTLREIGIPPNMASTVMVHQSWKSDTTKVIKVG